MTHSQRSQRSHPKRSSGARTLTAAVSTAILAALLLAGCTSTSSSDSSGSSGSSDTSMTGPDMAPDTADSSASGTSEVSTADRDVITTGSVSLTVTDPIAAAEDAVLLVEQAGGRVDSRSENPETSNQAASAFLSLRLPAAELDRTLAELKKLGDVNFVSLQASDVTQQSRDLDARITALQTSVDRLLALLRSATSTTDLISIETALSERQAELESLTSQRDYLTDQIDFSTVQLELYSEGTVAPGSPDGFWDGVITGWESLLGFLSGFLVVLGIVLPWLAGAAVLAAVILLFIRLVRRGRKAA